MIDNRRMLILSCSRRKRASDGLLPAIERYDGPCFRVLRRYLMGSQGRGFDLDMLILSAEYGLLSAQTPITYYERRLTPQRATELASATQASFQKFLENKEPYEQVLICMGKDYQRVLGDFSANLLPETTMQIADGSIAAMQAQLYDWLHGEPPPMPGYRARFDNRFSENYLQLSKQQILEKARYALIGDNSQAKKLRAWYVEIDDQRIAPKWLVSQVTGLPVSCFHTHFANQVLAQWGIPICRISGQDFREES